MSDEPECTRGTHGGDEMLKELTEVVMDRITPEMCTQGYILIPIGDDAHSLISHVHVSAETLSNVLSNLLTSLLMGGRPPED